MTARSVQRAVGQGAALLPSALVILLPKCPLCVAAWAGLFGAIGVDMATYQRWLLPLSVLVLVLSVWAISHRTQGNLRIAVVSASIAAMELILAGKLWLDSPAMTIAGSVILVGSGIAATVGRRRSRCDACVGTSSQRS